jgi:hypothetical protein
VINNFISTKYRKLSQEPQTKLAIVSWLFIIYRCSLFLVDKERQELVSKVFFNNTGQENGEKEVTSAITYLASFAGF